ncbi:hypothetical protein CEUSTIGMA_g4996.t1 [Chlamydomonas eustigma]|uniref:DNA 3'-5' helicase n=1 Tax=Chlamydomonas eustigma TaxID=1157962 RepID=A0A250X3T0_9CHLO|nr:hypothetical protein CEUSTIGMA_g4996.t1 [Chlamydomonas eustigma]|eukprot:GAX77552.1 hypothetical protein CEUSTIGMA_g4996.t1 [Chlamydomonas eustigma]
MSCTKRTAVIFKFKCGRNGDMASRQACDEAMSCALSSERLRDILSSQFNLSEFRQGQLDSIKATLEKKDSIVILPTGAGKSLTFQLPPFTCDYAFTVVVSPLISLARDQVEKAIDRGIDARIWNSETRDSERSSILSELQCEETGLRLLYVTPEGLQSPILKEALKAAYIYKTLLCFAVDEAHCISDWGHDFRPAYAGLRSLKVEFPCTPVSCLTASCTDEVQKNIQEVMGLRNAVVIKHSFNRPNIKYEVKCKALINNGGEDAVLKDLIAFIKERKGQCGIIYARLRTTCDWIGKELECAEGIDVAVYHAGKDSTLRQRVHSDWSSGYLQVVVATVAFGMGIDRADVRWVVHWNAPSSLEGLFQESGRAGRDGLPSVSVVYASQSDIDTVSKLEKGTRRGASLQVGNFLLAPGCRRKKLLAFFGEKRCPCMLPAEQVCDFCLNPNLITKQLLQIDQEQQECNNCMKDQESMNQLMNTDSNIHTTVQKPGTKSWLWSAASRYAGRRDDLSMCADFETRVLNLDAKVQCSFVVDNHILSACDKFGHDSPIHLRVSTESEHDDVRNIPLKRRKFKPPMKQR